MSTTTIINNFSLFANQNDKQPANRNADFNTVYKIVKNGTWLRNGDVNSLTNQLRAECQRSSQLTVREDIKASETIQSTIKTRLPFLTVSANYNADAISKDLFYPEYDEKGNIVYTTNKAGKQVPKLSTNYQAIHSGYICLDFDHLTPTQLFDLRTDFEQDKRTVMVFTSPRGEGLKLFLAVNGINNGNHKNICYSILLHFYSKYKLLADTSCTNQNRGTFLPCDSTIYYNVSAEAYGASEIVIQDAEKKVSFVRDQLKPSGNINLIPVDLINWTLPTNKPVIVTSNNQPVTNNIARVYSSDENLKTLDYIVNECKNRNISLSDCHDNNRKIGWALHSINADSSYFHAITSLNPDYEYDKMETRFNELENSFDNDKCGFGFLVNHAKTNGIILPYSQSVKAKMQRDIVKITQKDIRDAISMNYSFYFDEGSNAYYYSNALESNPFNYKSFTQRDNILNKILSDLEEQEIHITRSKLEESIFNPYCYKTIDYLMECMDYLGNDYVSNGNNIDLVGELLKSIDLIDKPLFELQFTKWLVNVVAQIYGKHKKHTNGNAIVLVGAQDSGKSSFFDQLLFNDDYYATKANFNFEKNTDLVLLSNRILINLDEMGAYGKNDIKLLKSGFTTPKLTLDRKFQDERNYKRVGSFVGCSNDTEFLRDDTGDRRFLVFEIIGYVDWIQYESVDKKMLWGQLVHLYKSGFDFKFSQQEIKDVVSRNAENFTVYKSEDTFISSCISITKNPNDFLSYDKLKLLINEFTAIYSSKGYFDEGSVKRKLKLKGATLSARGYAGKAQARGISGVTFRHPYAGMIK